MGAQRSGRNHGVGPWMLWGTDEIWVDAIMVLAHGCCGERMRSGWMLYGLPVDAPGQAGNYQVFTCLFPF